jgi:hypothetical protein
MRPVEAVKMVVVTLLAVAVAMVLVATMEGECLVKVENLKALARNQMPFEEFLAKIMIERWRTGPTSPPEEE